MLHKDVPFSKKKKITSLKKNFILPELKSNQLDVNSPHYISHSTNSKMPPQSQNKQQSNKEQQSDKHGLIRVKSNLFENYQPENQAKQQQHQHQQECNDNSSLLSGSNNNEVSEVTITSGNGNGNGTDNETMANALVYNKNSMDIYVKTKETTTEQKHNSTVKKTTPKSQHQKQQKKDVNHFEDIICAPNILEFNMSEDEDDGEGEETNELDFNVKPKTNEMDSTFMESENEISAFYMPSDMPVATSDSLYDMISQNFANDTTATFNSSGGECGSNNLLISSVSSLNIGNKKYKSSDQDHSEGKLLKNLQKLCSTEKKPAIGGLYLRNPRGNQVRQYDVNALYSALQDVKNGHSIYR